MHKDYCGTCQAFVPISKMVVERVAFALAAAAVGGKASKRWEVALVAMLIAAVLGHYVAEAIGGACAHCGSPTSRPRTI